MPTLGSFVLFHHFANYSFPSPFHQLRCCSNHYHAVIVLNGGCCMILQQCVGPGTTLCQTHSAATVAVSTLGQCQLLLDCCQLWDGSQSGKLSSSLSFKCHALSFSIKIVIAAESIVSVVCYWNIFLNRATRKRKRHQLTSLLFSSILFQCFILESDKKCLSRMF